MFRPTWFKILLIYLTCKVNSNMDDKSGSGAEFLQSMMSKIQIERFKSSLGMLANHLMMDKSDPATADIQPEIKNLLYRIVLPEQESTAYFDLEEPANVYEDVDDHPPENQQQKYRPTPQQQPQQNKPPTLPLSKEELLSLYQAAINKGADLNISSLASLMDNQGNEIVKPSNQGTLPGYYYYFYPIKSFAEGGEQQQNSESMMAMQNMMMQMQGQGMVMPGAPVKRFEPLFIAMASFVGVAMMFILSILFMPKFGNVRSDVAAVKEAAEEGNLSELSSIVFEAIEGRDCSERLACELGQAIRVMKLGAKPIRAIEIFLPPNLAKQLAQIRKSVTKKERCDYIPCREQFEKKVKPFTIRKPIISIKNHTATPAAG